MPTGGVAFVAGSGETPELKELFPVEPLLLVSSSSQNFGEKE